MLPSPQSTLPPLSPHCLPEKRLIRLALAGKTSWTLRQVDCLKRSTQTRCCGSERTSEEVRRGSGEVIGKWQVRSLFFFLSFFSQHLDPSQPQRSRLGSSYLCCTSHQLWAVGCTRRCTDYWMFSSGSSPESRGWYCKAW